MNQVLTYQNQDLTNIYILIMIINKISVRLFKSAFLTFKKIANNTGCRLRNVQSNTYASTHTYNFIGALYNTCLT